VTAYAEWALGTSRGSSAPGIVTALEPATRSILVRNPWNTEFAGRVAFLDLGGAADDMDGRSNRVPRAQRRSGPARWPEPRSPAWRNGGRGPRPVRKRSRPPSSSPMEKQTRVLVLLGEADGAAAAAALIERGRTADHEALLRDVSGFWDSAQGTVQVRTPDRSMDILLNGWLIYQTLACRLWARTAFYQAGGRLRVPGPAPGCSSPS